MERLISDLLLLAEIGEQQTSRTREAINLSDLLRIQITDLKLLNPERKIDDVIPPEIFITGNLSHIQQLMGNIFSNIRRHTPVDAPVYANVEYENDGVRITVADGGSGLPEAAFLNGIQQFQRFDSSRSRESGGSGLGMSIMQAIVREHNGLMKLERSALGGLAVNIFFPLHEK